MRRAFIRLSTNTRVQLFTSAGGNRPIPDWPAAVAVSRGVEWQHVFLSKSSLANRSSLLLLEVIFDCNSCIIAPNTRRLVRLAGEIFPPRYPNSEFLTGAHQIRFRDMLIVVCSIKRLLILKKRFCSYSELSIVKLITACTQLMNKSINQYQAYHLLSTKRRCFLRGASPFRAPEAVSAAARLGRCLAIS